MNLIIKKFEEIKDKLVPVHGYSSIDLHLFKAIIDRLVALVSKHFGPDSDYIDRLNQFAENRYLPAYDNTLEQVKNVIDIMIDDIELEEKKEENVSKPILAENRAKQIADEIKTLNSKIFIVHGHNESMKQSVARVIEKLELEPIILHEQSNLGNTVIEKFTRNSNVGFAIVLLSADDIGYAKKEGDSGAKNRARQNVILELGFFLGKLGRNRVVALVENMNDFELPSDINGIVYIPYSKDGSWKFGIVKELIANGYNLDANRII